MTWHYAVAGAQHGPVDDAQLDRLIAAGIVTGDTLVWRAGLDGWKPLREARPAAPIAASPPPPGGYASYAPPPGGSAAYALPRPRPDLEAEFARTAGRGVSPISAISRGMSLVFAKPGPTIGISALIVAMMIGAGFVPCVGSIVQILVTGPLTAAWYGYFLRHIRGQVASMEDVFAVFSSPDLGHIIGVHVVVTAISMVLMVPFVLLIFFTAIGSAAASAAAAAAADGNAAPFVMGPLALLPFLALLPVVAVMIYLTVAFMFAPVLVLDRGHAFWPAMRLSMRVVNRRLLPMIGLVLMACLIGLAGLLALCLGIFVAMPIIMASYAFAYEDLFGETGAA
jgi:uncharacterized membrane protein